MNTLYQQPHRAEANLIYSTENWLSDTRFYIFYDYCFERVGGGGKEEGEWRGRREGSREEGREGLY